MVEVTLDLGSAKCSTRSFTDVHTYSDTVHANKQSSVSFSVFLSVLKDCHENYTIVVKTGQLGY